MHLGLLYKSLGTIWLGDDMTVNPWYEGVEQKMWKDPSTLTYCPAFNQNP